MIRRNDEAARLLENIAKLLALKGDSPFRIRAYLEAAETIRAMTADIDQEHEAGRLTDIPDAGTSIAAKLAEYLTTGRLAYFEDLKRQVPVTAVDLLEIPGIGPVRAHLIHEKLGITSVPELEQAAREHRLHELPGIGEKLEERFGREAARVTQRAGRMLLGVALPAAEEVVRLLRRCPAVQAIHPAGSIRRMRETIGDIDILVASEQSREVTEAFVTLPVAREVLAHGPVRASILTPANLQIDLRILRPAG